jgi:Flp pilus assembly protein TadD
LEIDSTFAEAHAILGMSLAQTGRHEQSVSAMKDAVRNAPGNPSRLAALAWAYAKIGRVEDANEAVAQLDAMSKRRYVSSYDRALVEIALGNREHAKHLLAAAYEERASGLTYLSVDPAMDDLRGTPEFRDLLVKLNLRSP